ncbi:MAG: hypothetical protein NTY09_05815 [bacterium]|nr:hypothetical protein [bacterium]
METSDSQHEWGDGVVTFLDILGWKGIWTRKANALDQLKQLLSWFDDGLTHWNETNSAIGSKTKIVSISDTIALFTILPSKLERAIGELIPDSLGKISDYTDSIELHGFLCKLGIQ